MQTARKRKLLDESTCHAIPCSSKRVGFPATHVALVISFVGGMGMASRVEQYRERAADCERRAKCATDGGVRLAYRDVAMRWLEMASQAQRLEAEQGAA
jgi:hypothetical protein